MLERVCCSTFGFGTIVLSLLFDNCASLCDKNLCDREMLFQSYKGSVGLAPCCATDAPSRIPRNIRSKTECVLRCQEEGNCLGVNWKDPNTCEMFSLIPNNATHLSECSYFDEGDYNVRAVDKNHVRFQDGKKLGNLV